MLCRLTRTIFSFGSPCLDGGQYGHMVLRPDGTVYGYRHDNEVRWTLSDDTLQFHSLNGAVTSRLRHSGENIWAGRVSGRRWPLYLMPLLSLDAPPECGEARAPSIFVNTVPKSGTYFVEAALSHAGIASKRLHLSGRSTVDDYRGLSDDVIHQSPELVRVGCPTPLVTRLLIGEHVVGHVEQRDVIDEIRHQGVHVICVVRNLRDVLTSLFRFKRDKVRPLDASEAIWREAEASQQFLSFLCYARVDDLTYLREIAEVMATGFEAPLLRYEQLLSATFQPEQIDYFNAIAPDFGDRFAAGLRAALMQPTPTLSSKRSSDPEFWTPEVERLFGLLGLRELNAKLGYE